MGPSPGPYHALACRVRDISLAVQRMVIWPTYPCVLPFRPGPASTQLHRQTPPFHPARIEITLHRDGSTSILVHAQPQPTSSSPRSHARKLTSAPHTSVTALLLAAPHTSLVSSARLPFTLGSTNHFSHSCAGNVLTQGSGRPRDRSATHLSRRISTVLKSYNDSWTLSTLYMA